VVDEGGFQREGVGRVDCLGLVGAIGHLHRGVGCVLVDRDHVDGKALNEFDNKAQGSGGGLDWRNKLWSQRGAVIATEMKNNSGKLARWTTQAILAKADAMKLGFVSRANPRSNVGHLVLGVVGYKPREFASQMNLNLGNGWGIVRTIVDRIRALDEVNENEEEVTKYLLVKDPNKPVIRLYSVPAENVW